jgi:type II secretion system protein N
MLKLIAWIICFFICLSLFIFLTLPEAKIKNTLLAQMNQVLSVQGIHCDIEQAYPTLTLHGPSYRLQQIKLTKLSDGKTATLDSAVLSPAWLKFLTFKPGVRLQLNSDNGKAVLVLAKISQDSIQVQGSFDQFELKSNSPLSLLTGVQLQTTLQGEFDISTQPLHLNETDGMIRLDLEPIVLAEQTIQFFAIPKIQMSHGKIDASIQQGKLTLNEVKIGENKSQEDLFAQASGTLKLERDITTSKPDIKLRLSLPSGKVIAKYPILESVLSAALQSDKTYAYSLGGTFSFPDFRPLGNPAAGAASNAGMNP